MTDRTVRLFVACLFLLTTACADFSGIDQPSSFANQLQLQEGGNILIISVDARADHKKDWTLLRNAPSVVEIASSVSADEISNHSEDTMHVVRDTV